MIARPETAALEPLLEQLGLRQAAAVLPDWLDRLLPKVSLEAVPEMPPEERPGPPPLRPGPGVSPPPGAIDVIGTASFQ